MVLRYIGSENGLADSQTELNKTKAGEAAPKADKPKRTLKFCVLLLANLMVWTFVYNAFAADEKMPIWQFLNINRGMVTGIIYNEDAPSAIVCGQVVREGDQVNGYKVINMIMH